MTLQTVDTAAMQHLFTVIRDGGFGWTVAEVPDLMATLGWTIDTEIAGKGAVADTPWDVPDAEVALLYWQQRVESLTIRVTSRGSDEPADRAAVVGAFASLAAAACTVLGPATATIPGEVPRVQWRLATATVTLQNVGSGVLIVWCHNAYQDFNDYIGRY